MNENYEIVFMLKFIIKHQANMPSLWAIPLDRKQTMQEELLQAALRHIHATIEKDKNAVTNSLNAYWYVDVEL